MRTLKLCVYLTDGKSHGLIEIQATQNDATLEEEGQIAVGNSIFNVCQTRVGAYNQ